MDQKPFLMRCENHKPYRMFTQLKDYIQKKESETPKVTKTINYKKKEAISIL